MPALHRPLLSLPTVNISCWSAHLPQLATGDIGAIGGAYPVRRAVRLAQDERLRLEHKVRPPGRGNDSRRNTLKTVVAFADGDGWFFLLTGVVQVGL